MKVVKLSKIVFAASSMVLYCNGYKRSLNVFHVTVISVVPLAEIDGAT